MLIYRASYATSKTCRFSKGEADTLRKAMGKKREKSDKMKPIFDERAKQKGRKSEATRKIEGLGKICLLCF